MSSLVLRRWKYRAPFGPHRPLTPPSRNGDSRDQTPNVSWLASNNRLSTPLPVLATVSGCHQVPAGSQARDGADLREEASGQGPGHGLQVHGKGTWLPSFCVERLDVPRGGVPDVLFEPRSSMPRPGDVFTALPLRVVERFRISVSSCLALSWFSSRLPQR